MPRRKTSTPDGDMSLSLPGEGHTLHRDDIVSAAIAIADEEGAQAVNMRRIAARLGAGTMSLYWHVANKDKLIDLMLDAVAGEIAMPDPPSGNWRRDMRAIAVNTRTVFNRHRWLATFIGTWPWSGPGVLRHTELSMAVFDNAGVDLSTAIMLSGAVDAYVIGFVLEEFRSRAPALPPLHGPAASPGASGRGEGLPAAGAYPRLARLMNEGKAIDTDQRFSFGLERLLDGIAMHLSDPAGR